MKIIILICYYGRFPWYFDYFLHSCRYNPSVDFVILTDIPYEKELPPNVRIRRISLSGIRQLASRRLGFPVSLDAAYKLCDYKPAYGLIFSGLTEGYDFWGHGDIDIIFGNIRNFITDRILSAYDLICVRHDILTGYFQLFRNTPRLNNLFSLSKDYQKVYSSPQHYCFDETNFAFRQFQQGVPPEKIKCEIESMQQVVMKMDKAGYLRAYFDFHVIEGVPGRLKWEKGTLTYKNAFEVLLYHLIRFKEVWDPMAAPAHIPDTFHISPRRIYR
jgi:hypothetical protein